ncbi:MAG: hypothetical protein ACP5IB_02815 [Thermoplasmata archaeon]
MQSNMDLNHKVSRNIVKLVKEKNAGIKLEKLDGIRNIRNTLCFSIII